MNEKIICLGKEFDSEDERRVYFRNELRKKLPELKKMEGFPFGEDEDIVNLSDPPYYTACPNPWLNDFINQWENEKSELEKNGIRSRDFESQEPYTADVSEGKNDPIYNAHSYHTKVPPKAIVKYLLHYTSINDTVLDGFSGSGMTGVACNVLNDQSSLKEMGFNVEGGDVFDGSIKVGVFGQRKSILNDLSPAATNLTYNNTSTADLVEFRTEAKRLIQLAKDRFLWMFKTKDPATKNYFDVDYFVWSEISNCENCGVNLNFSEIAFEDDYKSFKDEVKCPNCSVEINKRNLKPQYESIFDKELNEVVKTPKREIILICFKNKGRKNYKRPDEEDLELLNQVRNLPASGIPLVSIPDMQMMRVGRMKASNIKYTHQFYFDRLKHVLSFLWNESEKIKNKRVKELVRYWLDSHFVNLSYRNRYRPNVSFPYNPMTGVFYIPMMSSEANPFIAYENKLKTILKAFVKITTPQGNAITSTTSASCLGIDDNSIDYIFTDPPFGENIYYSDLNFFIESWYKVFTNSDPEAIVDKVRSKSGLEYNRLVENCFREYFRVLKAGRWMTVVFSNTSASIWNGIQLALSNSGFIISNVSALDKQQGTFQAVNTTTAVKQDLVISCYKPSSTFDQKFLKNGNTEVGVWEFIQEHLNHLPIHLLKNKATQAIIERSPKILFDRLIAFYIQRGLPVPIDSNKLQQGLRERFIERDGMFFTNEQVQVYDLKKKENPEFIQLSILVSSEQDGVLWLKNLLSEKSRSYQDIQPLWMQALAGVRKGDIIPELADILEENFLKDSNGKWYVANPENESDLEKLRNKRLLKQFDAYKEEASKPKGKIKEARVEALRVGFKQCYQEKDFKTIVQIGDRIPNNLLMEDEVLLQFYDIAISRV
jgi:DNA modification methylase